MTMRVHCDFTVKTFFDKTFVNTAFIAKRIHVIAKKFARNNIVFFAKQSCSSIVIIKELELFILS